MIAVDRVTKTYGTFTAVDDVTFTARPGRITGFLGPNGAGKSTTLRVLVGLTPPDHGTAHVLGRRFRDLPNPGLEVGVLLDASAQHAGRTGREVLTIAQRTMGLPAGRVHDVLDLVGLSETEARRRLRDYSLGMRQRLGLAHALLGDPDVLVLDEPANGLDPAGIRWMRDLLRGYADRGSTVLLSSHLLHEIEVVADDLVVIGHGRVVAAGTKTDLLSGAGTHVATPHPEALSAALTSSGLTYRRTNPGPIDAADPTGDDRVSAVKRTVFRVDADPEAVGHVAWTAAVALTELRAADGAGLEEMFLALTADTQRDRPQHAAHHSMQGAGA
jgi:ABC-2 type transport system ATP-binding protein